MYSTVHCNWSRIVLELKFPFPDVNKCRQCEIHLTASSELAQHFIESLSFDNQASVEVFSNCNLSVDKKFINQIFDPELITLTPTMTDINSSLMSSFTALIDSQWNAGVHQHVKFSVQKILLLGIKLHLFICINRIMFAASSRRNAPKTKHLSAQCNTSMTISKSICLCRNFEKYDSYKCVSYLAARRPEQRDHTEFIDTHAGRRI